MKLPFPVALKIASRSLWLAVWLCAGSAAQAAPLLANLPVDLGWRAGAAGSAEPASKAPPATPAAPLKAPAPAYSAGPAAPAVAAPAAPAASATPTAAPAPAAVAPAAAPVPTASPRKTAVATPVVAASTGIGPGDVLQVTVFGQPDMSAEVSVTERGDVTLPLIGLIHLAGLSQAEVEQLVAQRLREREYLLHPEVSVSVRQNRSQAVSVLGEVQRPGRYPLQGRLTVLDLLALAGGLTPKADTVAFLLRKSAAAESDPAAQRLRIPIRLDRVADPDRSALDVQLSNDDMVYVGQQKFFYIHGEVRRPGSYPMEPELDLMRALSISGGVTERGSMGRISIHRKTDAPEGRDFSPRLTDAIVDGDVIYVKERIF